MKQKMNGLSQRDVTALQKHLRRGPEADLQAALRLGRQAVGSGLETLEMARIHEQALVTLALSGGKEGLLKRAEIFFTEAITPIVETHHTARQGKLQLGLLKAALSRRNVELAATNRRLRDGVVRRKKVEDALQKSGEHFTKLLKDSLELQVSLRQLTRDVLAAQEDERKKISRELQNEIGQTLLGINIRLLSLRVVARSNTRGLRREITSTQRLVAKSALAARRAARKN